MQKLFDEVLCPQCGKQFIVWDRATWRYRKEIKGYQRFFCRWSCLCKYNKEVAERESKRKKAFGERRKKKEKPDVQQVQEVRKETDGS